MGDMKRLLVGGVAFVVFAFYGIASAESGQILKTLRVGSRGSEVVVIQTLLKGIPDIYPEGLVTGYFGKATEAAVKRFQKKYGLEQVGFTGPKTREKLNTLLVVLIPAAVPTPSAVLAPAPAITPAPTPTPVLPSTPLVPADVTPPVVRLLTAGSIAKDRVVVSWVTNEPGDSRVEYGMNAIYDNIPLVDATFSKSHMVRITGLASGVSYGFRVTSRDAAGNTSISDNMAFRTLVNDLSQSTPGNCIVADVEKDIKTIGFGDDNLGVGYLKDRRPGAFSIHELRAHCRAEDFIALADNYCDANPGATIRKYFVSYQLPNEVIDVVDFCSTCAPVQCPLKR